MNLACMAENSGDLTDEPAELVLYGRFPSSIEVSSDSSSIEVTITVMESVGS